MFSDVKRVLRPNTSVATLNIKTCLIINLHFGMEGFLLTMQSSSYDAISFRQNTL